MLEIEVITEETFDEESNRFLSEASVKVHLEHSLVTVSKWESTWEIPFIGKDKKTHEQTLSYIEMMLIEDVPLVIFEKLVRKHLESIESYIASDMTATRLPNRSSDSMSREVITSELIYYWMISLNVPVEFEHWHLNRLITLIRVINLKNTPKKKMSAAERRNLNRSRLAKHKTKG
jgi:hypothetical protein